MDNLGTQVEQKAVWHMMQLWDARRGEHHVACHAIYSALLCSNSRTALPMHVYCISHAADLWG